MNRIILLCALLTHSFSVMAEPKYWMKKDNYNQLGLEVLAGGECPFTASELLKISEGEYLRARLKPTELTNDLGIYIHTNCIKVYNTKGRHEGYTIRYDINFAIKMTMPKIAYVHYDASRWGLQVTVRNEEEAKIDMLHMIRDAVGDSLTDYLKVNLEEEWEKP